MIETWKDIPGYDGKYQADREGNIRHVDPSGKERIMTGHILRKCQEVRGWW